jgi:hypothetical protein
MPTPFSYTHQENWDGDLLVGEHGRRPADETGVSAPLCLVPSKYKDIERHYGTDV